MISQPSPQNTTHANVLSSPNQKSLFGKRAAGKFSAFQSNKDTGPAASSSFKLQVSKRLPPNVVKHWTFMPEKERKKELDRRKKLLFGFLDVEKRIIRQIKEKQEKQNGVAPTVDVPQNDGDEGGLLSGGGGKGGLDQLWNRIKDRFIIGQKSRWKAIFDIWMLVLVGYSCFTTIYYVSFNIDPQGIWETIDLIVLVFFSLDLIFNFMMEYQDQETFMPVRQHKLIARRYLYSGWFFIDFASTFPVNYLTESNILWIKLFRLFRLPKLIKILDLSRFNRMLRSLFDSSTRQDRIVAQYVLMYSYKIFRLIIIAIIIIYFAGNIWYLLTSIVNTSEEDQEAGFINHYFTEAQGNSDRLIATCYFSMVTLTTAGYGDYYPQTQSEMICCFVIMLIGVAFFSFIMNAFIEIISNYDKKMGDDAVNRENAMTNWLTLVTRFQGGSSSGGAASAANAQVGGGSNKPLPKQLEGQIERHLVHFYENNRMKWLEEDFQPEGAREEDLKQEFGKGQSARDDPAATPSQLANDDDYLNVLPRQIKRNIVVSFLFEDVFHQYRLFFNTHKHQSEDSKFLYDIAFGLVPFRVEAGAGSDSLIYDEEDDVHEMYFVQEGVVGIGYYYYQQGLSQGGQEGGRISGGVKLGMFIHEGAFICDYYACCDRKSEFVYVAASSKAVSGLALSKKFLLKEIFPKYPEEAQEIKTQSLVRYRENVRKRLQKHRELHLREVNKKSSYKTIEVRDKPSGQVVPDESIFTTRGDVDLSAILRARLAEIRSAMDGFNNKLDSFAGSCDEETRKLYSSIALLRRNLETTQK